MKKIQYMGMLADDYDWVRGMLEFSDFGKTSELDRVEDVPRLTNEFWTARQRSAHSLHEISYRACFKPALPRFFIERLTRPGEHVYDPFMGRGTCILEANLLDRIGSGCDVNPLSRALLAPRLRPPGLKEIQDRLARLDWGWAGELPEDLLVFYHPETLSQLCALRAYLLEARLDEVDEWIRMVAINRLAGHSSGFFSVYTMPPNQAVTVEVQRKLNARRNQIPPRRDVASLILKKTVSLLNHAPPSWLRERGQASRLFVGSSQEPVAMRSSSVRLVVTSPPFLDVVNYAQDNWLRCWFLGVEPKGVAITVTRNVNQWQEVMQRVLAQMNRLLLPGGHVAFEVGEVRAGTLELERRVIPAARQVGLDPICVLVNRQYFTKTANCWGVSNGRKGTNTNRVVLLRKP